MTTLVNSIVLSNFLAIEQINWLPQLYQTIFIVHSVYEEIQQRVIDGHLFLDGLDDHIYPFQPTGWLHLVTLEGEVELALYRTMPPKLHHGEAMSLTIAAQRDYQFLTDDRAARQYAAHIGVSIGGTLGVLVQLIRRQWRTLDEANNMLHQSKIPSTCDRFKLAVGIKFYPLR